MHFDISAFTHAGTVRESNEDSILVNGRILRQGNINLLNHEDCFCFVADGVGGNKAGEFASHFVLEKLKLVSVLENIEQEVQVINEQLLKESELNEEIKGTATTLTGLIVNENRFKIIHAGDSQMWLLRNDMFFQLTKNQVLDETEENSSIISYFGGHGNYLKLDDSISINETFVGDILLICSDGLFKSLNLKVVKSILTSDIDLESKSKNILEACLQKGAEDNTSVILIHHKN